MWYRRRRHVKWKHGFVNCFSSSREVEIDLNNLNIFATHTPAHCGSLTNMLPPPTWKLVPKYTTSFGHCTHSKRLPHLSLFSIIENIYFNHIQRWPTHICFHFTQPKTWHAREVCIIRPCARENRSNAYRHVSWAHLLHSIYRYEQHCLYPSRPRILHLFFFWYSSGSHLNESEKDKYFSAAKVAL